VPVYQNGRRRDVYLREFALSKRWKPEYGTIFKDPDVVNAYRYRAPYPADTFKVLTSLITDEPKVVLDAGCGTGEIARYLAPFVDRVDAVDFSSPMLEVGKELPNGDNDNINWINEAIEEVSLNRAYSLITTGFSLHWIDRDRVFPRFKKMLTPNGYVAIIYNVFTPPPWERELNRIISKYSKAEPPRSRDLIKELVEIELFEKRGSTYTEAVVFEQSIDDYVEHFHSRSDLARVEIGVEAAASFDRELKELISCFVTGEVIRTELHATIVWGLPLNPPKSQSKEVKSK
jgi:ubiquinone/menaquinone biosynthesis C-methylase UbiE